MIFFIPEISRKSIREVIMSVNSRSQRVIPKYRELDKIIEKDVNEKRHLPDNQIALSLAGENDLYSPYSPGGAAINKDILDYIESATDHIPIKETVEIRLETENAAPDITEKLQGLVKKNIYTRMAGVKLELRRNTLISAAMAIFGLLLLGLQVLLSNRFENPITNEFLLIIC